MFDLQQDKEVNEEDKHLENQETNISLCTRGNTNNTTSLSQRVICAAQYCFPSLKSHVHRL